MARAGGAGPDPLRAPVEYHDITEVSGPLMVVSGVSDVGWNDYAEVRLESGERRHALVLEVSDTRAVVQVLEGTQGLDLQRPRVAFSGAPLRVPVGPQWLGRTCNGTGQPLDGGPPISGEDDADVNGAPMNPVQRDTPRDPILTGVSVIDGLTTLVRGQKLPIFSVGGLPHLELATQIAVQAHTDDGPFAVVFAAMGISHTDAEAVRDRLEARARAEDLAVLLNTADDPVIERILTPRIALTVAEHLAYQQGRHVLVVMADMTSYCEAVREVGAARGEIPGRRAYPGYLYSDLASLYERCGRLRGQPGSVTQMPVLTMPGGDMTHPVPDLTGYITEGQIVLTEERHVRGVYPPVEPLSSLSRLMRRGAGPGRTRGDHLDLAAQLLALLARARDIAELADLLGDEALSETERRYLSFAKAFDEHLVSQRRDEDRPLAETLDRGWQAAATLPRRELTMVPSDTLAARYPQSSQDAGRPAPEGRPS